MLSGGLDSILAIKLILDQNIEIIALNFSHPFSGRVHNGKLNPNDAAENLAKKLKLRYKRIVFGDEYLKIIQNPRFGYGKNLNPCLDCRIMMLKAAREYMQRLGASFVISGEVLGQRPMSQHKNALRMIEKQSGLKGLILRPLSARLLEPTIPEMRGLVNRERLLDLSGRSRKVQLKLARRYKISGNRDRYWISRRIGSGSSSRESTIRNQNP